MIRKRAEVGIRIIRKSSVRSPISLISIVNYDTEYDKFRRTILSIINDISS